jgi:hypothetical protein
MYFRRCRVSHYPGMYFTSHRPYTSSASNLTSITVYPPDLCSAFHLFRSGGRYRCMHEAPSGSSSDFFANKHALMQGISITCKYRGQFGRNTVLSPMNHFRMEEGSKIRGSGIQLKGRDNQRLGNAKGSAMCGVTGSTSECSVARTQGWPNQQTLVIYPGYTYSRADRY